MPTVDELKDLLEEAKLHIAVLSTKLEEIMSGPYTYATVIDATKKPRLRIAGSGGVTEIEIPIEQKEYKTLIKKSEEEKWDDDRKAQEIEKVRLKNLKKYPSGTRLLMSKAGAAAEEAEYMPLPGSTAIVRRILEDGMVELGGQEGSNSTRLLFPLPNVGPIEKGDQIVQDNSGTVVIRSLGKPVPMSPFKLERDLGVSWDDVGGLDEVKQFFQEVFILPSQHPEIYAKYNCKPPAGALLSGPPGNGKTLIAKAVATEVARTRGSAESGFFPVKGPEILSQWVGAAEAAIRELFTQARMFSSANNVPAVVFIDEAEAVMNKRGSGRSSDVDRTIVPAFLTEMDGMNAEGQVFVLLATNRPDLLDPAIVREGRIDKKVLVPRPDQLRAAHIFRIHLKNVPIFKQLTLNEVAEYAATYLFSETHAISRIKLASETRVFSLGNIASGAMIASIVQTSSALALRRDLRSKSITGVNLDDVRAAIDDVAHQNRQIAHEDDVKAFIEPFKDDVVEVVRV